MHHTLIIFSPLQNHISLSPFIFYSLIYNIIHTMQCIMFTSYQTATIRGIRTRHNIHFSIKTRRKVHMDHTKCTKCTIFARLQKLEIKRTELRCLDRVEEDGCREGVGYGCCSGLVRFSMHVCILYSICFSKKKLSTLHCIFIQYTCQHKNFL